jgi:hypothetical protein
MRRAILVFSLLGAVLFGAALVVSYTQPLLVERAARELLRIEVQSQVDESVVALSNSRIASFAARALHRTDEQIARQRQQLRAAASRRTEEILGFMLREDCACRLLLDELARDAGRNALAAQLQARDRLSDFIEATYASVSRDLLREFRIFTGSNALAFALLALVAFVRKRAKLQLLLPALAVLGAFGLTGGLYLFNQDWLHTIVFGDYLGWGYAAYLAGVALLLGDILLNRARVTTHIVNAALNLVGAAASAVPC